MQYSASPIMMHDVLALPNSNQQAMYLEHFLQSQEAAKCFDDDLDFCPSLTATELVEILKESASAQKRQQTRWQQQDRTSSNSSPTPPSCPLTAKKCLSNRAGSKAIAIVDPDSKVPVQLPGSMRNTKDVSSPLGVEMPRHGSFSSDSSMSSTESFPVSDMWTMDSSMEMHDAALLDWSFQQQQHQQHMLNMQQFQHWQQPHFMNDGFYAGLSSPPTSSRPVPQQEMFSPSMGMTMAF
ncbi:hypothetical protein BGX27_004718 [Mortierella sp. AM989]|nr:hypothetical protein BGX27_004718 [Mortierella sp. AM989]